MKLQEIKKNEQISPQVSKVRNGFALEDHVCIAT